MGGYRYPAGEPFIVDFGIVHLVVAGGYDHLVAPDVCRADAAHQVSAVDQERPVPARDLCRRPRIPVESLLAETLLIIRSSGLGHDLSGIVQYLVRQGA